MNTPEVSVSPIHLDPTPLVPVENTDPTIEEQAALRQSGIDKLTALGLTEDEAKAIAGI